MPKRKFIKNLYESTRLNTLKGSMYTGWYGNQIRRYRVKHYPKLKFYEIYDKNDMVVKTGQGLTKLFLMKEAKMYLQELLNDEMQIETHNFTKKEKEE